LKTETHPVRQREKRDENRPLLNLARESPCMLRLAPGCGQNASVACHSDMLRHGRGIGSKSHAAFAVPGCPACHAVFTRAKLGRDGYAEKWLAAHEEYMRWIWDGGLVVVR
jgi:hypothetical protein